MTASQFTWVAGQTLDPWAIDLFQPDGSTPSNVSGYTTLTLYLTNQSTGKEVTGGGTFTVVSVAQGQFTYAPAVADTTTPGVYLIKAQATFPTVGGVPQIKWWTLGTVTILPS